MGFDLLHRLPTAYESQFSSKQLSSSIDGVGRCPLPFISKRVLVSLHVLIERLLAAGLPAVMLAPSQWRIDHLAT